MRPLLGQELRVPRRVELSRPNLDRLQAGRAGSDHVALDVVADDGEAVERHARSGRRGAEEGGRRFSDERRFGTRRILEGRDERPGVEGGASLGQPEPVAMNGDQSGPAPERAKSGVQAFEREFASEISDQHHVGIHVRNVEPVEVRVRRTWQQQLNPLHASLRQPFRGRHRRGEHFLRLDLQSEPSQEVEYVPA